MARALPSSRDVGVAELVARFGMTPRHWTRLASTGQIPGAWQPSGQGGKWLFDLQAFIGWRQSKFKRVEQWPGYTNGAQRGGAVPSVTGKNIGSPSAPQIDALLKSVYGNG
jgi:hypothetical protein